MTPSSTPRRNAVPALWRWPAKYVSQVSVWESKWRTARGPWSRPSALSSGSAIEWSPPIPMWITRRATSGAIAASIRSKDSGK
jgi:hypothetical protein